MVLSQDEQTSDILGVLDCQTWFLLIQGSSTKEEESGSMCGRPRKLLGLATTQTLPRDMMLVPGDWWPSSVSKRINAVFYLATVFFSVPFGLVGPHDIAFPPHCFFSGDSLHRAKEVSVFIPRGITALFSGLYSGWRFMGTGSGVRKLEVGADFCSDVVIWDPLPQLPIPPTSHPLATKHSWNLPPATDTHCHGHRWKCQISAKKIVRNSQTYNVGNMGYPKPFHMWRKTI